MTRDNPESTTESDRRREDGERTVSEAREAIDAQLGDGGGCTEAWEALNRVRNSSTRRDVLNGLAAAGISAVGISGSAAAKSSDESIDSVPEKRVKKILSSSLVERVLEDTGVEDVDRESVVKSDPDDDHSTVVYSFATPAGILFYGERDSQTEAGISFGYSLEDGFEPLSEETKSELEQPFSDLPDVFSTYTVTRPETNDATPVQVRHLTEDEAEAVGETLSIDAEAITGVVSSDRDDVVVFDPEEERTRYLTGLPDDAPFDELSGEEIEDASEAVRFGTQGNCNDMLGECAATNGTTAACIAGCVTAGVSTWGAAFALCAICTGGTAFNAGIQCGQWYDQCV